MNNPRAYTNYGWLFSRGGKYLDDRDLIESPNRTGSPITRDELSAIFKGFDAMVSEDSVLLFELHKATNHLYHIMPMYTMKDQTLTLDSIKQNCDYLYFVSKESCKTKARAAQVARNELADFNEYILKINK